MKNKQELIDLGFVGSSEHMIYQLDLTPYIHLKYQEWDNTVWLCVPNRDLYLLLRLAEIQDLQSIIKLLKENG